MADIYSHAHSTSPNLASTTVHTQAHISNITPSYPTYPTSGAPAILPAGNTVMPSSSANLMNLNQSSNTGGISPAGQSYTNLPPTPNSLVTILGPNSGKYCRLDLKNLTNLGYKKYDIFLPLRYIWFFAGSIFVFNIIFSFF